MGNFKQLAQRDPMDVKRISQQLNNVPIRKALSRSGGPDPYLCWYTTDICLRSTASFPPPTSDTPRMSTLARNRQVQQLWTHSAAHFRHPRRPAVSTESFARRSENLARSYSQSVDHSSSYMEPISEQPRRVMFHDLNILEWPDVTTSRTHKQDACHIAMPKAAISSIPIWRIRTTLRRSEPRFKVFGPDKHTMHLLPTFNSPT